MYNFSGRFECNGSTVRKDYSQVTNPIDCEGCPLHISTQNQLINVSSNINVSNYDKFARTTLGVFPYSEDIVNAVVNFVSPFDLLKAPNQGNIFHLVSAIVGLADRPNTIFGKKSKPTEKVKLVCPRGHHKEVKLKVRRNGQS